MAKQAWILVDVSVVGTREWFIDAISRATARKGAWYPASPPLARQRRADLEAIWKAMPEPAVSNPRNLRRLRAHMPPP